MFKWLAKAIESKKGTYIYSRYFYTLTLVNGDMIAAENKFYTCFKWSAFVELDIYGKNNLLVNDEFLNTKNILKVVLDKTETIEREYFDDDYRRPSYIHDKKVVNI